MTGTKESYQLLADTLSQSIPLELVKNQLLQYTQWEDFVKIGSSQLVIPAVFWSLNNKSLLNCIPEDLRQYLSEIHEINRNRNVEILRQLTSIKTIFDNHKISYVLLKGSALIAQLPKQDLGVRMVGDIDILIIENQLLKAQEILIDNGYTKGKSWNYEVKNFRHLDRLIHSDFIAAIELHSHILNVEYRHLLSADALLNDCKTINGFFVPKSETLIKSIILSKELNDKASYFNTINFKSILDCIILKLPEKKQLIDSLLSNKYYMKFLASASFFFNEFTYLNNYKPIEKHNNRLQTTFRNPKYYARIFRIKWIMLNMKERIAIFLNNGSYRRHVLKNKIFPFFN